MLQYKSIIVMGLAILCLGGCKKDFAELNLSQDNLNYATPTELLVQSELEFDADPYMLWFANSPGFFYTTQMAVPTTGINYDVLTTGSNRQKFEYLKLLRILNDLKNNMSKYDDGERQKYTNIESAMETLTIFLAIMATDDCGDIPYTEAAQGRYKEIMTPKYDSVQELYDLWNECLKADTKAFSNPANQKNPGKSDIIYGGDWSKWAKFANSLRLKIAVRLLHADLAKAKIIVSEVLAEPCGVMDGENDDFVYHKADRPITVGTNSSLDKGHVPYGDDNSTINYNGICASEDIVNLLKKNKDPRVRFLYTKNEWNSEVVNYYLQNNQKAKIPKVVLKDVEIGTKDGKEYFVRWKGDGDPWVRYHGLPSEFNAKDNKEKYGELFSYDKYTLLEGKSYSPFSRYNEEFLRGRMDYNVPVAPKDKPIIDKEDYPHYGMYMTTAEVNFYLAEFAVYGGVTGIGQASAYYEKAVTKSVREWDRIAKLNKIPYYETTYGYDKNEMTIDLKEGEIETMMKNDFYKLTGNKEEDLEKIFINELIHFSYRPKDLFVTGRRSGIPKFNSKILPRRDYSSNNVSAGILARRTALNRPLQSDLMYEKMTESYQRQGFTFSLEPGTLNKERVWQDKGAPQWGEGPNVK